MLTFNWLGQGLIRTARVQRWGSARYSVRLDASGAGW